MSAIRGREAEIAVLGDALDLVDSGRRAVVLIEGEAGIGKTRLLDAALEAARRRGMQVAAGRAEELEGMRPFGLMTGVFGCTRSATDPRRAAIGELLSGGTGERNPITVTSDPGLRFRVVDALADLVEELALAGPLVIGVDDLQWADASSLLTLAALGRRAEYLPVALIACFRPSPRSAELDRLAASLAGPPGRYLSLGGLGAAAVADLAADAMGTAPGQGLLAGLAGAAGNPLFVTEMLAALAQEGMLETAGGRAEVAQTALPPTLRLTILRRLSFLSDDMLQALRFASILGASFTVTDLSVTMDRPVVELFGVLAEGITGRVLEDDGDRLRFRHDVIRDAIYEDMPATIRHGLHREAGQRLARTGAPALQVAEHLARGAARGDTEAVGWLSRAAREAAAKSPEVAAALLGRARRTRARHLLAAAHRDRTVRRPGLGQHRADVARRPRWLRGHGGRGRRGGRGVRGPHDDHDRQLHVRDRVPELAAGTGESFGLLVGRSVLTPTERTVASLVAEGPSNPQIGDRLYISHRTVQTHLAHVFAKLGLTSRAQLAAEATRQEAP